MPNSNKQRKSTGMSTSNHSKEENSCFFSDKDRQQLQEINETIKLLKDELQSLKGELAESKSLVNAVKAENVQLKQALNLTNFKLDNLEQYGRRENLRIHNIPEPLTNIEDGEEKVLKLAEALKINLSSIEIQRAHRLGKKKTNMKPRPIIVRFQSYKKRSEFLYRKSNLKNHEEFHSAFISEDLTPTRAKLLRYLKEECDNNFVLIHTLNGKIRFKKSAAKNGQPLDENGRDAGFGKWLTVDSPDDLFKVGIDIDFAKFSHSPLNYNVDVFTEDSG